MKCPNCNSENVSFISNMQKRGFSVADACCGWLLFHNWIGILCGAIGANKTKTQDYWVCNNCGRKFQAKQMQKYNKQFINQETSTPQIEEKTKQEQQSPIAVRSITDPKTYVERTASYSGSLSVEALLKRAMLYLEDSEWEKAYEYAENALDVDAECAEAYLTKFLAEYNINSADDIPSECEEMLMEIESLTELTSYGKAMRFADDELKAKLEGYNNETIYRFAANLQDKSGLGTDIPAQLKETIRLFRSISGYKDADEKAEKCKEKIRIYENGVNRENYKKACDLLKEAEKGGEYQIANYINAVKQFKECGNYSDAVDKYIECREAMYNIADELSNNPTSIHDIDNAILLFQNTFGYKDSVARSNKLEENRDDIWHEQRKKEFDKAVAPMKNVFDKGLTAVKNKYNSHKKVINVSACIIVAIIILAITIPFVIEKVKVSNSYNQATHLLDEGNYAEASKIFESLGDYKDSKQLTLKSIYQSALKLIEEKNYSEASELLFSLGDYEDSKNLALESTYQNALKLADEKEYSDAINEFGKILNYRNSAMLYDKYEDYAEAYQFVENGDFSKAITAFEKIGDEEMVNEVAYAYASELYNDQNYKLAQIYFEKALDYKDTNKKLEEIDAIIKDEKQAQELQVAYDEAVNLMECGSYKEATEAFQDLGDYKDSAEKAKEAEKLYQDSLPKTIDGAAEEVKSKFNFDGGVLEYSGYTYYRVIDGYLDIYNNIGNFNLILEEGSTVELDIEKGLSKLTVSPEVDNATFYSTYPSMVLDEYSYTSYYDYRVYSVALVDKYLFVTSEYTCNNTGAWDLSWIIPEYKTIIFDTVTGKEVQLDEIADTSKLKEYAYEYAVNDVYNSSYDATYNWKENLYYDTWYEDDECWSVSDGSLEVIYNNIIEGMSYYECRVCVHIPINIFKSCFY
ncbi:MAG: hypothetical protein J6K17_09475 [Oscillospiraceae bacterium]|nr:hypothetical protein [Oscillospiraceae bacterium]